MELILDST